MDQIVINILDGLVLVLIGTLAIAFGWLVPTMVGIIAMPKSKLNEWSMVKGMAVTWLVGFAVTVIVLFVLYCIGWIGQYLNII